jgi:MATE family multidrug resistance protein
LATVLAQYSGLALALFFFLRKYKAYQIKFPFKKIAERVALIRFFKVNTDLFIRTLLFLMVLAMFISHSAEQGDILLAVNTLLFQLFYFFSYFADGFAFAAEALTGKAKGARNKKELKTVIKDVFKWSLGIAVVFTVIYGVGLDVIIKGFTTDELVRSYARIYYPWVIVIPLISIGAFTWDGIYIGLTSTKAMRNIGIVVSLFVFLPAYYLTRGFWGNHALWFAFDLFMFTRSLGMWIMAKKQL